MGKVETGLHEAITRRMIDQQVDALRLAAGLSNDAQAILDALAIALRQTLATRPRRRSTLEKQIQQAQKQIEQAYRQLQALQTQALQDYAPVLAADNTTALRQIMPQAIGIAAPVIPKIADLLILGSPAKDWWQAQARSTQQAFARELRLGFVSGQSTDEIAARIIGARATPGILDVSRRQARQLVHTSIMALANQVREATYQANQDVVRGLRWLATLDGRTCLFCAARDGQRYGLDHRPLDHDLPWEGGPGASHFGCRCVATAVLVPLQELGLDVDDFTGSTRASMDGQVDAKLTFEHWLQGKSKAFQDEYFGPGRADLWRNGHLTLAELLDMRGRPLTIDALKEKVASG
ncbi:phage minor head protein [Castellaniella defragrans]|nr:phage minor head protein [Castellaniella defragrans]